MESALYAIYGREAFQQMRKVSGHMNGVLISGYVGVGELSRGNRQQQSFFVNGRYFRSAALSRALEKGCEGSVMIGRFPMCALFLELPRQTVDVNVHPNKLEVRFQNEIAVASAVEMLVREAMHAESLGSRLAAAAKPVQEAEQEKPVMTVVELEPPPVHQEQSETLKKAAIEKIAEIPADVKQAIQQLKPVVVPPITRTGSLRQEGAAAWPKPAAIPPIAPEKPRPSIPEKSVVVPAPPQPRAIPVVKAETLPVKAEQPTEEAEQTILSEVAAMETPLRMVGILFDTYWIFESGDRVLLVDQHAAHERILYDQMMARFERERISQALLSPQLVRLSPHDMSLISEFSPALAEAGFEVEAFDDASIALRAIPTFFGVNDSPKELLLEALAEWQAGRGQVTRERLRRRVAQMACKRAIKGGDRLSETEIRGFMQEMLKSDSMPTCPHGRPIVTEITRYALEKRFKRIQ